HLRGRFSRIRRLPGRAGLPDPVAADPERVRLSRAARVLRGLALVLGVVWASPWTLLGLLAGLAGLPLGARLRLARRERALLFAGYPWGPGGAMTLGNVILCTGPDLDASCATYEHRAGRCRQRQVRLGDHERAHVYQYMLLGPLFVPVYFLCGGGSVRNPLERAAALYALHGHRWWPGRRYTPADRPLPATTVSPGANTVWLRWLHVFLTPRCPHSPAWSDKNKKKRKGHVVDSALRGRKQGREAALRAQRLHQVHAGDRRTWTRDLRRADGAPGPLRDGADHGAGEPVRRPGRTAGRKAFRGGRPGGLTSARGGGGPAKAAAPGGRETGGPAQAGPFRWGQGPDGTAGPGSGLAWR